VEVIDQPVSTAVPAAEAVLARLDALGIEGPRLVHGQDETCWPLLRYAARRWLATRIGLEDTTMGPDGEPAPDNAALVRHAHGVGAGARTA
jgi:hypothetical protein